jgi:GNAT superfamily N-acetyltransferase
MPQPSGELSGKPSPEPSLDAHPSDVELRALRPEDLPAVASLSAAAFDFEILEPSLAYRWEGRMAHLLGSDPHGAFVAEFDGTVIGVAQAMRRERLWCLSLLTVHPAFQSFGAGGRLFERALAYADPADAGLILSSDDPRALRLYALAGFSLKPTFDASGEIDRAALPRPDPRVREGGRADLDALAPISREIRGAAHTSEIEHALSFDGQLLLHTDRGFAVVTPEHCVWLLAARDEDAATALLWAALAQAEESERAVVRWITAGQQWAIEVLLRAGMRLGCYGALAVRGDPGPLRPFLPSGPFA